MDAEEAWPLVGPGVWLSVAADRPARPGAALFLDRDGVIVEEVGFLSSPDRVRLERGAARLIGAANRAGMPVAAVSNQSGIARGHFGWAAFARVEARIARLLAAEGARLDATAACPFHPDATPGYGAAEARWRKPGPGMLLALAERLGVAPGRSWMVGDRASDVAAAKGAGLRGAVLVLTGYGRGQRAEALALRRDGFAVEVAATPGRALDALAAAGALSVRK